MMMHLFSAFSHKLIVIIILNNFSNVTDLQMNLFPDEETKTTSPGYLPSDSGSSTLENVEPELGNDDVDALKILVIVLIVVSVIFLVFLLILVIYISTNGNCFKHSVSITLENSKQKSGE